MLSLGYCWDACRGRTQSGRKRTDGCHMYMLQLHINTCCAFNFNFRFYICKATFISPHVGWPKQLDAPDSILRPTNIGRFLRTVSSAFKFLIKCATISIHPVCPNNQKRQGLRISNSSFTNSQVSNHICAPHQHKSENRLNETNT